MTRAHVRISVDAETQLAAIRAWWLGNRPAAPDLFDRELDAAITELGAAPAGFPVYRREAGADVRRVFLPKTRYALYYSEEPDAILIVAVWHMARGSGPPLP